MHRYVLRPLCYSFGRQSFCSSKPHELLLLSQSLPLVETPLTTSSCSQALSSSFFPILISLILWISFSYFTVLGFVKHIIGCGVAQSVFLSMFRSWDRWRHRQSYLREMEFDVNVEGCTESWRGRVCPECQDGHILSEGLVSEDVLWQPLSGQLFGWASKNCMGYVLYENRKSC